MATIAENLQSLVTAKNDIATAITNKGVILPENAGFLNFASAIDSITSSVQPIELHPTDITDRETNSSWIVTREYRYPSEGIYVYPPYAYIINGTAMALKIYIGHKQDSGEDYYNTFVFNDLPIMPPNSTCYTKANIEFYRKISGSTGYLKIDQLGYNNDGKFYIRVMSTCLNTCYTGHFILISYV
jgi:hypothetical protein